MKSEMLSKTARILISSSSSISFETKHFNMQSLVCSEALIFTWVES